MTSPAFRSPTAAASLGRGVVARVLAGLLLVLQVFVVGAVPVLDGGADHSDRVIVHVEDAQQDDCPVSHDAEDCQLCQVLTSIRGIPARAGEVGRPTVVRVAAAPVDMRAGAPALVFLSGNASRAPPRA